MRTEDEIRENLGKPILGFDDDEKNVKQGTGQTTSFNTIDPTKFKGVLDKPDGWYLPNDSTRPAIIAEFKAEKFDLTQSHVDELLKNINIISKFYSRTIGVLYNGRETRVFFNGEENHDLSNELRHKSYYINIMNDKKIDKNEIYSVTKRINDNLHFKFGMTDLQDRMIFTACALVAARYKDDVLPRMKDMGYELFHNAISKTVSENIASDARVNEKLNILVEEYNKVQMSITENQEAINNFIDDVSRISTLVNSIYWYGKDVMGIFFNEFSRYKGKSDAGQIFTPDHITSFMYRLIDINQDDKVLDATCGSGAFLMKAMSKMIRNAGFEENKTKKIKQEQLFGIELYRKIFALACANMLIHKDGKTNLRQMDAQTEEAFLWIKSQGITKVLMNPPYERKYGCMKIVANVLNAVSQGTQCAFILPDKKLEKDGGRKLLKNHRLTKIIKMPENLFFGVGITTSIFVFEAGKPQADFDIIGYYIEDDGLETVKNQGRHDVKGKWQDIEDYWIEAIRNGHEEKYGTRQIINPNEHLSYQMPEKPFEIFEEDFLKTMMDYELFKRGIDVKQFNADVLEATLYGESDE